MENLKLGVCVCISSICVMSNDTSALCRVLDIVFTLHWYKIQEWIIFGIDDLCVFLLEKNIIVKGENTVKIGCDCKMSIIS